VVVKPLGLVTVLSSVEVGFGFLLEYQKETFYSGILNKKSVTPHFFYLLDFIYGFFRPKTMWGEGIKIKFQYMLLWAYNDALPIFEQVIKTREKTLNIEV
jgi:hypothetical protein